MSGMFSCRTCVVVKRCNAELPYLRKLLIKKKIIVRSTRHIAEKEDSVVFCLEHTPTRDKNLVSEEIKGRRGYSPSSCGHGEGWKRFPETIA